MEKIDGEKYQLLQHTLGAGEHSKKKDWGYRNYFLAGDNDSKTDKALKELEEIGYMTSRPGGKMVGGGRYYFATKEGMIAIGFKPYQIRNAFKD